jgi:hypothetical protein
MNHGYGIEPPSAHRHSPLQQPVRYVVVIDSGGSMIARLFLASRELVAEFDAGTEEVVQMTRGLQPTRDARASEWDRALAGHSVAERAAAEVYTLDL